jgi:hypothetical protein
VAICKSWATASTATDGVHDQLLSRGCFL